MRGDGKHKEAVDDGSISNKRNEFIHSLIYSLTHFLVPEDIFLPDF